MAKKIEVMGRTLDNNPIRGSLLILDKLMNDPMPSLAQMVDGPYLSLVTEGAVDEYLSLCNHTIIWDVTLLKQAKEDNGQRLSEVQSERFVEEFFKRLERQKRKVYLLAETAQELDKMKSGLKDDFADMNVVGSYSFEEADAEGERIVNDINDTLPDVILSTVSSPAQEKFYLDHRNKMSTRLFMGMGNAFYYKHNTGGIRKLLHKIVSRKALKSMEHAEQKQWML